MITKENRAKLDKAFSERLGGIDDVPDDQLAEYREEIDQQARQGDKDVAFTDKWYANSEKKKRDESYDFNSLKEI